MASRISWTRLGRTSDIGRETPNVQGANLDGLYDAFDADHDPPTGMHDAEKIAYGGGYIRFDAVDVPPTYTLEEKYGIVDTVTPVSTGLLTVNLSFSDWSQYSQMADDGSGNYYYKVVHQAIGSFVPYATIVNTLAASSFRIQIFDLSTIAVNGDVVFEVFGRLAA